MCFLAGFFTFRLEKYMLKLLTIFKEKRYLWAITEQSQIKDDFDVWNFNICKIFFFFRTSGTNWTSCYVTLLSAKLAGKTWFLVYPSWLYSVCVYIKNSEKMFILCVNIFIVDFACRLFEAISRALCVRTTHTQAQSWKPFFCSLLFFRLLMRMPLYTCRFIKRQPNQNRWVEVYLGTDFVWTTSTHKKCLGEFIKSQMFDI